MGPRRNSASADRQQRIAELQRELAEVRRELDERIAERDEALQREIATAEVLGVINASPGDLAPVFDAMLEKALRLCDAAFGWFWTYEGDRFQVTALHGAPPPLVDFLEQPQRGEFHPGTGVGRLLHGEWLTIHTDMAAEEAYRAADPLRRALVDLGGARSGVTIALRRDERSLDAFTLYRQEVRPFTAKQIALVQNFAAQAVIAMENARLITETREALEQQTATAEVLQVINASPGELAPVFDAMLEKATRLCGAETGHLLRYENGDFSCVASHGVPEGFDRLVPLNTPLGDLNTKASLPFRMLAGRSVVHVTDPRQDESYRSGAPAELAAVEAGIRSVIAVPLLKEGEVVGGFMMHRREVRPFTDKQIALLENFAAQAVIAMENARLLAELRQRTDEVAELNRGLEARVAEQVEELGRVGRLKRFLAPQLAELIVSQGDEEILESHRREIVAVFCDLRGYTAFTETAEPEEVLNFLREYHGALGPLVSQFEGTLDQFSGDGIMVFFNDPVPIPDPAERAVKMAMAMRKEAGRLIITWRERGRELGFGAGIDQGYATLGQIGFAERSGYTAIGTVCNVAARLCAEAKDGQILLSQRVNAALRGSVATEQVGALALRGLTQPVVAYNVLQAGGEETATA
jgi:class 3 adenylate cyclase